MFMSKDRNKQSFRPNDRLKETESVTKNRITREREGVFLQEDHVRLGVNGLILSLFHS